MSGSLHSPSRSLTSGAGQICCSIGTKYMLRPPLKFHKLRPPSQAFKQHTLIEELSSNVNVHNALKLAQRPL